MGVWSDVHTDSNGWRYDVSTQPGRAPALNQQHNHIPYLDSSTPSIHPPTMQDATQDAAIQLAETIQTAHINHAPDRRLDVNPSTAASTKQPVEIDPFADAGAASDVDEDEVPAQS